MATPPAESKTPARNRKAFVRTQIPFVERAASVLIVVLLAAIGIAIWLKGKHFDPGVYSLRTDALKSTISNPEGKASTLRADTDVGNELTSANPAAVAAANTKSSAAESGYGGEESGGAASSAARPAVKGEPLEIVLAGLKPMSATEFYSPENLFEKIDGRAPAYLGFNFRQLRCRSFEVTGSGGSFVDVFEYYMDSPANAFGIFSLERDPKGKRLDYAPDGYSSEMGFFFRQGACYVQIIASDQKPKTIELAQALAQDRAKNLPADNAGLDARRRLPNAGLIPETVAFVQENAQGQEFLKDVFQANYQFEGVNLPFFVMVATPDAAAAAWKAYKAFAEKFGKINLLPETNGAQVFQVEAFGSWKVIYQRQGELGGVFDAADAEKSRQFVEKYLAGQIQ
jgi:hypothetical protein